MVMARFCTKWMVLLVSIFLLSACGGDDTTTTTSLTSEGTATTPFPTPLPVNTDTPHSGQVGNKVAGKSYYTTAAVTPNTTYTITLYGLSADADLEVYNDRPFTYILGPECVSQNGSTIVERCTVTTNSTTTTMYIAVDGSDTLSGATYTISVNAVSLPKSTCTVYPDCFSFDSATVLPSQFVSSGTGATWNPWSIDCTSDATETVVGSCSVRSGVTLDSGTSCFSYTPPVATSFVSFNRKVSSEQYNDLLLFYIDDVLQPVVWSGNVDWQRVIFNTVSATHTYKWCYSKNSSTADPIDRAWVDDIGIK